MSQRYGWILNLDAELELARGRPGYVAQQKLLRQLAEHGGSSRALLGVHDLLLEPAAPGEPLPTRPSNLLGRAWCPTPLALARLQELGVTPEPHPTAEVLRRVNHRLFAHELGGGLPDQAYVQSKEQLLARLGDLARPWLLKRPLGFAGRGQLRAIGPLSDKQWTWVEASLGRDGLLIEPLVTPTYEVSLHGFIWPHGRRELGRICSQLVSERGVFRGVCLARKDELTTGEHAALYERALRHRETREVARQRFGIGNVRVVKTKGRFIAAIPIDERRLRVRGLERFIGRERAELPDAREVVIAEQQHHLLRRMRRQPFNETQAVSGRRRALFWSAEVEVVAHRDQLHVVAQPISVEQPMLPEHREHRVERCLRVSHCHVARHTSATLPV
jgi:hypothetical protein